MLIRKILLVSLLGVITVYGVISEEQEAYPPAAAHFSAGYSVNNRASDFGIGINITSPYFLWDRMAIRINGEMLWNRERWDYYFLAKLGLIGASGYIGKIIRLYGEAGVAIVFPGDSLSTTQYAIGGYGLFGFEFFIITDKAGSGPSYYIELGSTGVYCRADLLPSSPSMVSGFSATAGFRWYF